MEGVRRAMYLGQDGCGIMVVWAEGWAHGDYYIPLSTFVYV